MAADTSALARKLNRFLPLRPDELASNSSNGRATWRNSPHGIVTVSQLIDSGRACGT